MKLLGSPASPYTRKVRVVLAEKRIECEMELVDVQPVENRVNAHNPLGKIPTLLLDDGSALYDSLVIVDFLDARWPISRWAAASAGSISASPARSTGTPSTRASRSTIASSWSARRSSTRCRRRRRRSTRRALRLWRA